MSLVRPAKRRGKVTLTDVIGPVWASDRLAMLGLEPGSVVFVDESSQPPAIEIRGSRHRTRRVLDLPPEAFAGSFAGWLDQQVVDMIREHAQPYARLPETRAADEMEYLGFVAE